MAWTTTVLFEMNVEGNRKMVFGKTTTDSGDDDVATGLSRVDSFLFSHSGSAVEASSAVIKETLPNTDGNINVICTSGDVLYWLAIGF
ncbi:hypothetical protein QKV95_gp092 [Poseidoniales virus YSH_150918]|uniref:Uncharacterized protein n=1 Tax=Poseidoniales virus YSH_150918 TaxID=3071324 RepID=A0A976UB07_9CAUD|nr:hypothetical protein QKV95_gp092 [Yangshan Harbor Poseidoniales virus]UVF62569.1 hypothetical protein [Poseidoniales virus YSH_150918]